MQVVVRPFEWDITSPVYGSYLEWTLAASVTGWSNYVTLGDPPRYIYEGYREAIESGFPLGPRARELRLTECTNEIRWGARAGEGGATSEGIGVPGFSYSPTPREWLERAQAGEFDPVSFHVNERAVRYDPRRSAFKGAEGPEQRGFLAVANAKASRAIQAFAREPQFDVRLSASACTMIQVSPNAWYDDALVREHARRMIPVAGREREPGAGWWGPRGLFNLMTAGFIVAYRPRAEFCVGAETHAELLAYRGRAPRLSVGPCMFHFGDEVRVEALGGGSFRYLCESSSSVPQIVGASARVLGDPTYVAREPSQPLTRAFAR